MINELIAIKDINLFAAKYAVSLSIASSNFLLIFPAFWQRLKIGLANLDVKMR